MITPAEQRELVRLNDLHLAGKTADAARQAHHRLQEVDTRDFSNRDVADLHAERATQALVFLTSQVDRLSLLVQAFPYLLDIARIVSQHYPVAKEESARQIRETYWREGFSGRDGYIIALRDMYRSLRLLGAVLGDTGLLKLAERTKEKVTQFARLHPSDHEALQFLIQEGTLQEAAQALDIYEAFYAADNQKEAIVLTSTVLAKAIEASTKTSWSEAAVLFGKLVKQAQEDPKGIGTLVAREIAKKTGKHVLKMQERHEKDLHAQLVRIRSAYDTDEIEMLAKLRV